MLITPAFADTAAAAPQGTALGMLVQFVLIIAILYFLLIRPQQKRLKKHEQELDSIQVGSRIVVGGLTGVVKKAEPLELLVEIAPDTEVTVLRPYVSQVLYDEKEVSKKGK
ncbi:MAG: preprotein translocase subunit YajC [Alphaproteobacteria bacterium]